MPDLPSIGYVLSVGFLTLLFFARERRAATPIPDANLNKPEDRRLEVPAEAVEEKLRLKRLELARINDANLELDLELARKTLEKRREEEALGILLRPVADMLNPKPSLSPSAVDAILGWQAPGAAMPDVTLEFSSPGPFTLRNFGATVCEVQIECDSLNESEIYDVGFPIVADLHNAPIVVTPEIDPSSLYSNKDIMSVLRAIARQRARLVQGNNSNSLETARIVSEMEPIHFQLWVTYSDRRKARQWQASEVLVYDPRKEKAYIKHGGTFIIKDQSDTKP
jgi:hypothetical protein